MLHYYQEITSPDYPLGIGFYIDRMKILSPSFPYTLDMALNRNEYFQESAYFRISSASEKAGEGFFRTSIDVTAPSRKCLELLAQYFNQEKKQYKISSLEITRDIFFRTRDEAENITLSHIMNARRRYASQCQIYDAYMEDERKKRKRPEKGLFSRWTLYAGPNNFKYTCYARLSKINNTPCYHDEWRIKSSLIKEKTGISTIEDILSYDLQSFFNKQYKRLITHKEIDTDKLGKWLLGWGRRKAFTDRQKMGIGLEAHHFCICYKINTFADLARTLIKLKKESKAKKGRKTYWDNKILALKDYGRFAISPTLSSSYNNNNLPPLPLIFPSR
jgi:hypothetical protein